jgi:hypothetical protein
MGYMRHHAVVVTSWKDELIEAAHGKAIDLFDEYETTFGSRDLRDCVSPIVGNGMTRSFVVAPDGSKEGWNLSDAGDTARRALIGWLDEQRYDDDSTSIDWVEVQFGDDDGETVIVNDSDRRRRRITA